VKHEHRLFYQQITIPLSGNIIGLYQLQASTYRCCSDNGQQRSVKTHRRVSTLCHNIISMLRTHRLESTTDSQWIIQDPRIDSTYQLIYMYKYLSRPRVTVNADRVRAAQTHPASCLPACFLSPPSV